jgi:hypothetical protein
MTDLAPERAKLQYDLTAITARVSEIQRHIASLNAETGPRYRCGGCGLIVKRAGPAACHEQATLTGSGHNPSCEGKSSPPRVIVREHFTGKSELSSCGRHIRGELWRHGSAFFFPSFSGSGTWGAGRERGSSPGARSRRRQRRLSDRGRADFPSTRTCGAPRSQQHRQYWLTGSKTFADRQTR